MELEKLSLTELKKECKSRKLSGYSHLSKKKILDLLHTSSSCKVSEPLAQPLTEPVPLVEQKETITFPVSSEHQRIVCGDIMNILPTLTDASAQIILADPPYNIGKDFGNKSDCQELGEYLEWCDRWIEGCLRVLRDDGTMFIFGFSEILALILARVPMNIQRRWLVWHYTNKNSANLNFWQRSHESILVLWKKDKIFHRDAVREAYTDSFLQGAAGKERASTKGRFSDGKKKTVYKAHPLGALPRDVIKIPALAGGAGRNERVDHPTQKPLSLCERLLLSCQWIPSSDSKDCNINQDVPFVLIPFAGSGSECVAAKRLGLPFLGVEINPVYAEMAQKRIAEVEAAVEAVLDSAETTQPSFQEVISTDNDSFA